MNFDSILITKNSSKNNCFGADGELLYILPPTAEPDRETRHLFTGVCTKSENQYGWVRKSSTMFTLEDFIDRAGLPKDDRVCELLSFLLTAIGRLDEGTPVAVDYFLRGLPPKPTLIVHKIIFQKRSRM
jgi:hypothetical protein